MNGKRVEKQIKTIYQVALREHPEFCDLNEMRFKQVIRQELKRIDIFEEIGRQDKKDFDIDLSIAWNIGAIWVFSGPGTYDKPFKEDDKFKKYPWAKWMDRSRLDHAAHLARRIAEIRSGRTINARSRGAFSRNEEIKELIRNYGPYIIYNGLPVENATIEDVLTREGIVIPVKKIKIIQGNLKNTVDQIRTFALPADPDLKGKDIALVSHAPHLDRVIHMIAKYDPLPKGSIPHLFPLSTTWSGREEFAAMEIRGLLYRMFITKDAAEQPVPYVMSRPFKVSPTGSRIPGYVLFAKLGSGIIRKKNIASLFSVGLAMAFMLALGSFTNIQAPFATSPAISDPQQLQIQPQSALNPGVVNQIGTRPPATVAVAAPPKPIAMLAENNVPAKPCCCTWCKTH